MVNKMEYIDSGIPGLKASRIGLSTCSMSPGILNSEQRRWAKETMIEALNNGINVIDIGATGESRLVEDMVGRVINEYGNRATVIIVAKTRMEELRSDPGRTDTKKISQTLESSLKRLRTDYIDIYKISHWALSAQFPGVLQEAARFIKEGKVRMLGMDDQLCEPLQVPGSGPGIHFAQFPYNMFERHAELDIIPYVQTNRMAAIVNRSLCSGLLAGAIREDALFGLHDMRSLDPLFNAANLPRYLAAVRTLDSLAMQRFSRNVVHLSIRWLLDRLKNSIVLWGARRPDHLNPVDRVMGWHIDGDSFKLIDGALAGLTGQNGTLEFQSSAALGGTR
jgi:aryl-alcohol dehydrogenase-like predicted oxidoreductase